MALRYHLVGQFIESCNCRVICPCWVDDLPTEEFCAGLFAWTFDPGSTIEGESVEGMTVVSVTVHGDRRRGSGSESVLLVDERLEHAARQRLGEAFAGRAGGSLAQIAGVTGDVIDVSPARIQLTEEGAEWRLRVSSPADSPYVDVGGGPAHFDTDADPMQLTHTALGSELGIDATPVIAQRSSHLRIDLAALPGEAIDVIGRSGMRGPFRYVGTDRVVDADAEPGGTFWDPDADPEP